MIAAVLVDADREYEIVSGSPEWVASLEWARFHGLDPNRIPAGSYIERDAAGRRVLFTEFLPAEDGGPLIVDGDVVTVERVEQGEAPPLPFPREVTG